MCIYAFYIVICRGYGRTQGRILKGAGPSYIYIFLLQIILKFVRKNNLGFVFLIFDPRYFFFLLQSGRLKIELLVPSLPGSTQIQTFD